MRYRVIQPVPQLAQAVDCIWTLEGTTTPGAPPEPILPDGRPELVLHFGAPFERVEAEASELQASVLYAGQVTRPLVLRPTGRVAVVGVRFHPDGAAAMFGHPQHELAGLTLGVDAAGARPPPAGTRTSPISFAIFASSRAARPASTCGVRDS